MTEKYILKTPEDLRENYQVKIATQLINKYFCENKYPSKGMKFCQAVSEYAKIKYNETFPISDREYWRKWIIGKYNSGGFQCKSKPTVKVYTKKRKTKKRIVYEDFLSSKYWKEVRLTVIYRDGRKCTKCGSTKLLHVHHETYKNHYFEKDHLEDLITLCKQCHTNLHDDKKFIASRKPRRFKPTPKAD